MDELEKLKKRLAATEKAFCNLQQEFYAKTTSEATKAAPPPVQDGKGNILTQGAVNGMMKQIEDLKKEAEKWKKKAAELQKQLDTKSKTREKPKEEEKQE